MQTLPPNFRLYYKKKLFSSPLERAFSFKVYHIYESNGLTCLVIRRIKGLTCLQIDSFDVLKLED